jgi:mono/diheme cytochrome c family protein
MSKNLNVLLVCGLAVASAGSSLDANDSTAVTNAGLTFEADVRPILKTHCFQCHGEEPELSGGFDVRLVRLMIAGGDSGPALDPGNPSESLVWDRIASGEMPPGSKKISPDEQQTIAAWIAAGAKTARQEPEDPDQVVFTEEELGHWAFQPVTAKAPPSLDNSVDDLAQILAAGENPIDAFVAAKLSDAGMSMSPRADRRTLIRRLTHVLHGLPPTPEQVSAFLEDQSIDAYDRLVDRLLASPDFGVQWGRHWLDVAGYAESDGNLGKDQTRPYAWHYRDYVIEAINSDLPYDRFVTEQLAGDELIQGVPDPNNPAHVRLLTATGFLRMAPDVTETNDSLMDRNQAVADVLNTVSSAISGITTACAQCHDHRYDPITIEDYYRFRAIFDPVFPLDQWKKPNQRLIDMTDDKTRQLAAEIEKRAVEMQQDIDQRRRAHCQTIQDREIELAPEELRDALRQAVNVKPDQQSEEQKALLDRFPKVRTIDWIVGQLIEYDMPAHRAFQEEEKKVAEIRDTKPASRMLMAVDERGKEPPVSHVFFRGSPESPTDVVTPGELTVLVSRRSNAELAAADSAAAVSSGRRLAYARQLTDGTHPLTARVAVNRVWMHYFGNGIVATAGDFGIAGDRPSHPELLDWLAEEFVRHGWSMKWLHRQISTSQVFQQASESRTMGDGSEVASGDPDNALLGRFRLRRMQAEAIRDSILAVSGQLNRSLGGPSVPVCEDGEGKPVIGIRLLRDGLFNGVQDVGAEAQRRSLYISVARDLKLNMLDNFDLPAMTPNCQQRDNSTVASQSLWFLNDQTMLDASRMMAHRLVEQAGDRDSQIQRAFLLTFSVPPTDEELQSCRGFLDRQTEIFRNQGGNSAAESQSSDAQPETPESLALASLCQMLMASNRFLYIP